ncbi:methyl-accepting chemotaxis protein [Pseudomonas sp. MAP12]|uniref:Methyl-accepting chemotaxis protein n=1 Tax=Geopseudomonas aromaticivorans TaxID=2849492 RepID=A0ABS6N1S5_9GAMM|nr:methyl-accepting chemotaxis protein [Pseudomonas aromaticivorans]MBV2135009.1 methyl-accepting chemotaxis protein [Pseudomonas aromaticivorans]
MSSLQSKGMALSSAERRWLPWLGRNGKLAMAWSCWLNRDALPEVEKIFEGIAQTRVRLLQNWTRSQWSWLAELADGLARDFTWLDNRLLQDKLGQASDFSELFVVSPEGVVLASSWPEHCKVSDVDPYALDAGLHQPFLHGPYVDPLTLAIGPSSSRFHDEVTLMFYQPIRRDGQLLGCLCGRVPNDVLGDLIQREAGHVYAESGDNYLFMVESRFDSRIRPGTALSRSRFEDNTFSHGDNLKSGVHTRWGTVRVRRHTELELRFVDPATGELHPGVRETIRNGSNLFVTYPGYSDYRHIPVVGKGVTFKLPGSPDRWGMMCEADLEEVYRRRSLTFGLMRTFLLTMGSWYAIDTALQNYSGLAQNVLDLLSLGLLVLFSLLFAAFGPRRLARRMGEMTGVIRTIAEGGGNLSQRLDRNRLANDETGDMGRWINSFIDNLDGIVGEVISASHSVGQTNAQMLVHNNEACSTSTSVAEAMRSMLQLVEEQLGEIQQASMTAEDMKHAMDAVISSARENTQSIRNVVDRSASSVQSLDSRMGQIGNIVELISEITIQTNLLALNAAIEAARAGAHGRGFAVVAGEIRTLASRTASAADEIRHVVEGLQAETRDAVAFMNHGVENVDASLRQAEQGASENMRLQQAVERMFGLIKQLDQRSQHYGLTVRGVDEVSQEMNQTLRALQGSTSSVRHTTSKLQQLVGQFAVSQG